eukprot:CAMPEP_0119380236 /NCGR_PEP_ID=MMETSP1334-20130426/56095_1 /TAXON_ID=127549 /ORGANISM="Calcidiscus leptoporus, Strain RCC1130" /LENGTH=483 /DNA_ID=CAMNT_0007399985 /DNA_START=96 /DNA_END=1543 /DNA_ORIENTATION=-
MGEKHTSTRQVFIIGQQKAASTSAYWAVLTVLNMWNSGRSNMPKELNYFTFPQHVSISQRRMALQRYTDPNGWLVEGTPDYFSDALAFAQILMTFQRSARIILLLRDPIDRAHAAFYQNKREGAEPNMTFADAMYRELADLWRRCSIHRPPSGPISSIAPREAASLAAEINLASPWYVLNGRRPSNHVWQLQLVRSVATPRLSHRSRPYCVRNWHDEWLRHVSDCGSCHQYLVRGLVARKLQAWQHAWGKSLLVIQTELFEQAMTEAAVNISTFLGLATNLSASQRTKLAHMSRRSCWHPPCANGNSKEMDIPESLETLLKAFFLNDRAEVRALEPTMVWRRWSDVEPMQPPPLMAVLPAAHRENRLPPYSVENPPPSNLRMHRLTMKHGPLSHADKWIEMNGNYTIFRNRTKARTAASSGDHGEDMTARHHRHHNATTDEARKKRIAVLESLPVEMRRVVTRMWEAQERRRSMARGRVGQFR